MTSKGAKETIVSKLGFKSSSSSKAEAELRKENAHLRRKMDELAKRHVRPPDSDKSKLLERILSLETLRERNNQQLLVKEQEMEILRKQLSARGGEVVVSLQAQLEQRRREAEQRDRLFQSLSEETGNLKNKLAAVSTRCQVLETQTQETQNGQVPSAGQAVVQDQLRDALEKNQQWLVYDQQREAYVQSVLSRTRELEQQLSHTSSDAPAKSGGPEQSSSQDQEHHDRQLLEAKRALETQSQQTAQAQQELQAQRGEVTRAQEELRSQKEQVSKLLEDLVLVQRRCEEKSGELSSFQRRYEEQSRELTSFQRRYEEKGRELTSFQRKYEEQNGEQTSFQRRYEEKSRELTSFQRKYEEQNREQTSFQRRYEEKSRELTSFQRRYEEKSRELEETKELLHTERLGNRQRDASSDRVDRMIQELETMDAKLEEERKRSAELQQQLSAKDCENEKITQHQWRKVLKELRKARDQITRLEAAQQQPQPSTRFSEPSSYSRLELERLTIGDSPTAFSSSKVGNLMDESFLECPKCQASYPTSQHRELLNHMDYCFT